MSIDHELDSCLDTLRAIGEETILAGFQGGDRTVTLQNVRSMRLAMAYSFLALQLCTNFDGSLPPATVKAIRAALAHYPQIL